MTQKNSLTVCRGEDRRIHEATLKMYEQLPWIHRAIGRWRIRAQARIERLKHLWTHIPPSSASIVLLTILALWSIVGDADAQTSITIPQQTVTIPAAPAVCVALNTNPPQTICGAGLALSTSSSTCTTPQPNSQTQTVSCPTGTTGSWTQTRTYSAAPYPTCWTAGAWTPATAPANACVVNAPPVAGAPTVQAQGLTWKVSFPPVAGATNYRVLDPNQSWLSSDAGSGRPQPAPPILVQGANGSVTGSFAYASKVGGVWGGFSPVSNPSALGGSLPAFTDPYWVYHAGQFNWSCDFSWVGGDTASSIQLSWFDTSVTAVSGSGPATIKVVTPVSGAFEPCASGTTVDFIGHPYTYWTALIRPEYSGALFDLKMEGSGDLINTNDVAIAQYVTAPTPGVFTANVWNHVNVPMTALKLTSGVYKEILGQLNGQAGTYHLDNLGFANAPQ